MDIVRCIISQCFAIFGNIVQNIARGTTDPWVDTITGGTLQAGINCGPSSQSDTWREKSIHSLPGLIRATYARVQRPKAVQTQMFYQETCERCCEDKVES